MLLRLRRRSDEELRVLVAEASDHLLTYEPVGCSLDPGLNAAGLTRRSWYVVAHGADAFDAGVRLLRSWGVHRGAGLSVVASGELAVGCTVAMSAPLPFGFVDVTCRVVSVVDEDVRFGFAYGTLPVHPEIGEESFTVERIAAGARFDVVAVSRVKHPLGRLAPWIAHRLQASAAERYLTAFTSAASATRRDPSP